MTDISVRNRPDRSRFEILIGDHVAGFAVYDIDGDRTVFTHTEVEDGHEGEGLGSHLVKAALDQTRAAGRRVVPECPFVADYIEHHPAYADLVDSEEG